MRMNKEDAIRFASLMEDYLNIPSFVCEMIQQSLEAKEYEKVIEYIIKRRNEIESKEDYVNQQQVINIYNNKLEEKNKEIARLNNIIDELKKILEYDKNDYGGDIDDETHNIDSEFLRGNAWEADYILNQLKELKENNDEE